MYIGRAISLGQKWWQSNFGLNMHIQKVFSFGGRLGGCFVFLFWCSHKFSVASQLCSQFYMCLKTKQDWHIKPFMSNRTCSWWLEDTKYPITTSIVKALVCKDPCMVWFMLWKGKKKTFKNHCSKWFKVGWWWWVGTIFYFPEVVVSNSTGNNKNIQTFFISVDHH